MKTIATLLLIGSFSFAGTLTVTATPNSPILIPSGSGTNLNGQALNPPYFVLNSIGVNWTSDENLVLSAVRIYSSDSSATVDCVSFGNDLDGLFSYKPMTPVVLQPGSYSSKPLGCGDLNLPTPLASNFDIPVTVEVTAVTVVNGNPVTVTSSAMVHVQ